MPLRPALLDTALAWSPTMPALPHAAHVKASADNRIAAYVKSLKRQCRLMQLNSNRLAQYRLPPALSTGQLCFMQPSNGPA